MKFIFFTLFITFNSIVTILHGQGKVIFREKFSKDNLNQWTQVNDGEFTVQIKNNSISFNKLHKNRENNGCLWYKKSIPNFQTEKDFRISFDAIIVSSDDVVNGFDIQWGMLADTILNSDLSTSLYQLYFGLTNVRLAKFNNLNGWTYFDSFGYYDKKSSTFKIKKGKKYSYTIKQVGTTLNVSVNNSIVCKFELETLVGNSIGVQQCLKCNWEMKNFLIKQ